MAVPSLSVQTQGQGSASADQLNTFMQGCPAATYLRNLVGVTGMNVFVAGYAAAFDGGAGVFTWDATSTSADNGTTIIAPTWAATGRWVRIGYLSATP